MTEISELSERERDILRLVATGASNKEIARELKISTNTVKVHLRNIFSKIGVSSRTEAAMIAVRQGFVNPQDTTINRGIQDAYSTGEGGISDQAEVFSTLDKMKRRSPVALLIVLSIAILGGTLFYYWWAANRSTPRSQISATINPRWTEHASLPQARYGLSLVAFENEIYAIGGSTGSEITSRAEKYNPETNSWALLRNKPTGVMDAQAVILGGKIYIPGGQLEDQSITNVLEVYDPRKDSWEQKASLPFPISRYSLVSFEGKMYLFGGWDGTSYLDHVYVYDPSLDNWELAAPMPLKGGYTAAIVSNSKIYIIGGTDGNAALDECQIFQPSYDIESGIPWSECAPLPDGRYGMGATSIADIIQVVGGISESGLDPKPVELFPQEEQWVVSEGLAVDTPAHFGMVVQGLRVYLIGGLLDGEPQSMNISYQAVYTVLIPVIQ